MRDAAAIEALCAAEASREQSSQTPRADGRFQAKAWEKIGDVDDGEVRRRVTSYRSKAGRGYAIIFYFRRGETTWSRVVNFGPESFRESAWREHKQPTVRVKRET